MAAWPRGRSYAKSPPALQPLPGRGAPAGARTCRLARNGSTRRLSMSIVCLRIRRRHPMSANPSDLFAFLDRLGIAHASMTHPPLFTVGQSQSLRGTIPGGHTKNLFLKDKKGALFLVTALEDAIIDLKSLHRLLGAGGRFSFGSADLLRTTLGIEPGAVTPFAAMNDADMRVSVVLDADLMRHATINCHPLVNTMTTSIAREGLVRFLEATGHTPRVVAVAEQAAPPAR
jgi:Ala-tRNA(Pro) deacylase